MTKIALLVGVSHCTSGFDPLPAAVRDVEALRAVLEDPDRGGFDEVRVLPNPQFLALRTAIGALFANRVETDLLLFYFSGHGIADEYGRFYFTTADTQAGVNGRTDLATTLEAGFVHQQMERCDSGRQVVILDCCHSGAFPAGMKARGAETIDFERQLGGAGRVVLASSSAMDYSFEREGEELAIYTRYLVEGLRTGAADLDEDGYVSVDELHEYVRKKVQKAAPSMEPERYVFRDGEKIRLAKAVVTDPERQYRKCVERYVGEGEVSPAGRRVLLQNQRRLGLSAEVAERIQAEVLQPYREYQESLRDYEEALRESLALHSPLRERDERDLADLRKELKLRPEDVKQLHDRLLRADRITAAPTNGPQPKFESKSQPFVEDLGNGITLEMVQIPGGEFLMGAPENEEGRSDDEGPQHSVTVASFLLGKFQVTQAQWRQVAAMKKVKLDLAPEPSHFKGPDHPVEQVSWHEVTEFCERLSRATNRAYRLPSEAEWEYACRAGSTTSYSFGNSDSQLGSYAWYSGNSNSETHPVGKKTPNAWGLYDMHGNVWEWCADHWNGSYQGAPSDGRPWINGSGNTSRLLRGGSWCNSSGNCRSALRNNYNPDDRSYCSGFRIACSSASPRT